ncbi:hypothetical protein SAMN02983003_0864 [Devosia enhydra]|uniref:Uncharacterized protein n=1 Tax=Devosia enhydra TaxID=665118 RepID=A0A1K2HVY9_9HYPH|nr:hypothetical protein [Devosia enhydra]SFZ82072.1 hypothetical protein SAMN02983003_0864 [Devosia enhydra]
MSPLRAERGDGLPQRIGVKIVDGGPALVGGPGVAVLRLSAPHAHEGGAACPACEAALDLRSRLWSLVEEARMGLRPGFSTVLVDASLLPDSAGLADMLVPGRVPARSLSHHMVARRFVLLDEG